MSDRERDAEVCAGMDEKVGPKHCGCMSSVDMDIVFAKMKACEEALKRLNACERPVAPRNETGKWAVFEEKMGECVRYFDAFYKNTRVDTENLARAKWSLDEADEGLKAWAGGRKGLYDTERGSLGPQVAHCKREIAWLLERVGEAGGADADDGLVKVVSEERLEGRFGDGHTIQVRKYGAKDRRGEYQEWVDGEFHKRLPDFKEAQDMGMGQLAHMRVLLAEMGGLSAQAPGKCIL